DVPAAEVVAVVAGGRVDVHRRWGRCAEQPAAAGEVLLVSGTCGGRAVGAAGGLVVLVAGHGVGDRLLHAPGRAVGLLERAHATAVVLVVTDRQHGNHTGYAGR